MAGVSVASEQWKDIRDYEGMYQVSNYGNVKSLDREIRTAAGHVARYRSKMLRHNVLKNTGYHIVCLGIAQKRKYCLVHRLVAQAFVGDIPEGMEVDHIDANKDNNQADNLEIVTPSENTRRKHRLNPTLQRGEKNNAARITEETAKRIIALLRDGERVCNIARQCGASIGCIEGIKSGKNWRHLNKPAEGVLR